VSRHVRSAGFVRAVLDGHSVLGLVAAALLYLVCASGTLTVFSDAFENWEQPSARPVASMAPDEVDRAMRQAMALAGGPEKTFALYAVLPGDMQPRLSVTTYGADGHGSLLDGTGTLQDKQASWTQFIIDLHADLTLAPPWGAGLVGLAGVTLLALVITGLLAHPRIFKDAFSFRPLRSARLRETDLHNRLSVWGLPFHVTMAATGALFGLASFLTMGISAIAYHGDASWAGTALGGPAVAADAMPMPLPPLAPMLQALGPDAQDPVYVYIVRPGTAGQKITIETRAPGRLAAGEHYYFDGTGAPLGSGGFVRGSIGPQIYAAAGGLHFGTYGGLPVRLVYGVMGLALSIVAAGGVTIWLVRRRDRGRPAPHLERAWTGIVWGVPFGFATSAALVLETRAPPGGCFWLSLLLAIAVALGHRSRNSASRRLRAAIAALLAFLVARESLRYGALAWSGDALVCNLICLAGMLTLALPLRAIRPGVGIASSSASAPP
jgi:uncharacterized iron-regulated membrane protein